MLGLLKAVFGSDAENLRTHICSLNGRAWIVKKKSPSWSGFSLVELMIVVAVIGILAAAVIPAYTGYVQRSKISEAINTLSEMRVRMERHFQDMRTYEGACNDPNDINQPKTQAPLPCLQKDEITNECKPITLGGFTIACPELTATTFSITATAGPGALDGLVYQMNERNVRTTVSVPDGWAGTTRNCWVKNKGDTC
jgi:type IV pilus assembly protein PilE